MVQGYGLTETAPIVSANPLPLELYVRQGDFPSQTLYDYFSFLEVPGGCLSISTFDLNLRGLQRVFGRAIGSYP